MSDLLQTLCLLTASLVGQDASSYRPPDSMRPAGDIAFEVRFVTISDSTFAKLFPDQSRKGPVPCTRVRNIRCIKNEKVARLLEKMQSEPRTNIMHAPRLTTFKGSLATIKVASTEC